MLSSVGASVSETVPPNDPGRVPCPARGLHAPDVRRLRAASAARLRQRAAGDASDVREHPGRQRCPQRAERLIAHGQRDRRRAGRRRAGLGRCGAHSERRAEPAGCGACARDGVAPGGRHRGRARERRDGRRAAERAAGAGLADRRRVAGTEAQREAVDRLRGQVGEGVDEPARLRIDLHADHELHAQAVWRGAALSDDEEPHEVVRSEAGCARNTSPGTAPTSGESRTTLRPSTRSGRSRGRGGRRRTARRCSRSAAVGVSRPRSAARPQGA